MASMESSMVESLLMTTYDLYDLAIFNFSALAKPYFAIWLQAAVCCAAAS